MPRINWRSSTVATGRVNVLPMTYPISINTRALMFWPKNKLADEMKHLIFSQIWLRLRAQKPNLARQENDALKNARLDDGVTVLGRAAHEVGDHPAHLAAHRVVTELKQPPKRWQHVARQDHLHSNKFENGRQQRNQRNQATILV
jgi:hypothetical protein